MIKMEVSVHVILKGKNTGTVRFIINSFLLLYRSHYFIVIDILCHLCQSHYFPSSLYNKITRVRSLQGLQEIFYLWFSVKPRYY